MEKPKVVVGIVTYNRYDLLIKSIESVIRQDYPNLDIVVLDDSSTDGTTDIQKEYPNIKYYKSVTKSGQVLGRNQLMASFDAEYYVSLDDDAFFMLNTIITDSVEYMNQHDNIAIMGYDIIGPNNPKTLFKSSIPFRRADFVGCGHILRLKPVKEVSYYTPGLGWGEEQDLSLKLHAAHYEIYGFPGLFVWHGMTTEARDYITQWRAQVNNVLSLVLRYYPVAIVLPFLIYKVFSLLFFSISNKKIYPYRLGLVDFVKRSMQIVKNRQPVKYVTIRKYHRLLKE